MYLNHWLSKEKLLSNYNSNILQEIWGDISFRRRGDTFPLTLWYMEQDVMSDSPLTRPEGKGNKASTVPK